MPTISTFVFFDLEGTGLTGPGDRPRITEISMVAVHRHVLLDGIPACLPRVMDKLTLCVQPLKSIPLIVSQKTGLYNDTLSRQKDFDQSLATILSQFLQRHQAPVCLVAHNGYGYDFGLLQAELACIGCSLPEGILCVDSLQLFRSLDNVENDPRTLQLHTPRLRNVSRTTLNLSVSNTVTNEARCSGGYNTSEKLAQKQIQMTADDKQSASISMVKRKLFPDDTDIKETQARQQQQHIEVKKPCLTSLHNDSNVASLQLVKGNGEGRPEASQNTRASSLNQDDRNKLHSDTDSTSTISHCQNNVMSAEDKTATVFNKPDQNERDTVPDNTECLKSHPTIALESQQTIPYWEGESGGWNKPDNVGCSNACSQSISSLESSHISDSVLAGVDLSGITMAVDSQDATSDQIKLVTCDVLAEQCIGNANQPLTGQNNSTSNIDTGVNSTTCHGPVTENNKICSSDKLVAVPSTELNGIGQDTAANTPATTIHPAYRTPVRETAQGNTTIISKPPTFKNSAASSSSSTASPASRVSYRLEEIHSRVVGCYPSASHRAEDDALALVRIFQVSGIKTVSWADQHATPIAEVPPIYSVRHRKPLTDGQFLF